MIDQSVVNIGDMSRWRPSNADASQIYHPQEKQLPEQIFQQASQDPRNNFNLTDQSKSNHILSADASQLLSVNLDTTGDAYP